MIRTILFECCRQSDTSWRHLERVEVGARDALDRVAVEPGAQHAHLLERVARLTKHEHDDQGGSSGCGCVYECVWGRRQEDDWASEAREDEVPLHCSASQCIAVHRSASQCIASHRIASHRASHRITWHSITLHYMAFYYTALHGILLHRITTSRGRFS